MWEVRAPAVATLFLAVIGRLHEEVCFQVALCVALAGDTEETWRPLAAGRAVTGLDGVAAVVAIWRDLLVTAAGVPDGHLVVPWVPRLRRRPIMERCRVC